MSVARLMDFLLHLFLYSKNGMKDGVRMRELKVIYRHRTLTLVCGKKAAEMTNNGTMERPKEYGLG